MWEKTVLRTVEELKPYHYKDAYEVGDYDAPITVTEQVWDIPKLLEAQAEITWKARDKEVEEARQEGIREVMEEIERERFAEPQYIPQSGREPVIICLTESWLEAFKKEKE